MGTICVPDARKHRADLGFIDRYASAGPYAGTTRECAGEPPEDWDVHAADPGP